MMFLTLADVIGRTFGYPIVGAVEITELIMGMMIYLTYTALISYTIANALAPKVAKGGHALNAATFGSITCIMTGFNMLVIPPIASGILLQSA